MSLKDDLKIKIDDSLLNGYKYVYVRNSEIDRINKLIDDGEIQTLGSNSQFRVHGTVIEDKTTYTHEALLIGKRAIQQKECEHPNATRCSNNKWFCYDCNKDLKPNWTVVE